MDNNPQQPPSTIPLPLPLSQSDLESVRVELVSKMNQISHCGKQIKGIITELNNQRDDLIRKQVEFDHFVKSVQNDIKSRWDEIHAKDELIEIMKNNLKSKEEWVHAAEDKIKEETEVIKARDDALTHKETKWAAPQTLAQILSQMDPVMFKHSEITNVFGDALIKPGVMKRLKEIVDSKLTVKAAKKLIATIPHDGGNDDSGDGLDRYYWDDIINQCNGYSAQYGEEDSQLLIEFRCKQLSKQIHLSLPHYIDLIRFIFDTGDDLHTNPHKSGMTTPSKTLNKYYWKSDSDSGKAPPFTPELKIFFKAPNIANNAWIQCSGPGTVLWDIDPNFKLTLGSLCDPDEQEEFKFRSISTQDAVTTHQFNIFNGRMCDSSHRISFKWE